MKGTMVKFGRTNGYHKVIFLLVETVLCYDIFGNILMNPTSHTVPNDYVITFESSRMGRGSSIHATSDESTRKNVNLNLYMLLNFMDGSFVSDYRLLEILVSYFVCTTTLNL